MSQPSPKYLHYAYQQMSLTEFEPSQRPDLGAILVTLRMYTTTNILKISKENFMSFHPREWDRTNFMQFLRQDNNVKTHPLPGMSDEGHTQGFYLELQPRY